MANRGARMTKTQKEAMIQYFEEHSIMISPKVSPGDLPQVKKHWEILSNLLNGEMGAKKSVKQWKEAWNELKTNVRRKARENAYDIKGTGGGEKKAKELSEFEEKVMGLISIIVIQGAPVPEAGIESIENHSEEVLLEEYIVPPDESTIPMPLPDLPLNPYPQAEAEVVTPHSRKGKKATPKRRNAPIHPMQQVVNTHETCLHDVASSNNKIAEALLVLGTCIARTGKKNSQSAVFQLKF